MRIEVYTDGSCNPNPGNGGWAWIEYHISGDSSISFCDYGGMKNTTSPRMEMTAILEYLVSLNELKNEHLSKHIYIYSDNEYCVNTLVSEDEPLLSIPGKYSGWIKGWIKNDYKGKKNVDLWKKIDVVFRKLLKRGYEFEIHHVYGHSTCDGNNEVDRLANIGRIKFDHFSQI